MSKKIYFIGFLFILIATTVFAAGGGGGGSSGSGSVPEPAPAVVQPATVPPAPIEPVCTEHTWSCGQWSTCNEFGEQTRGCVISNLCEGASNSSPQIRQTCPGLTCGQLATLEERVTCRLKLSDAQLAAELSILYFPEYCKVEESDEEKQECIALYRSFAPCWEKPSGSPRRLSCARKILKLRPIEKEKEKCHAMKERKKRVMCNAAFNEKYENYMLFQMYEYEQRAEELLKAGKLSLEAVAAFDVFVEEHKRLIEESVRRALWEKLLAQVVAEWVKLER